MQAFTSFISPSVRASLRYFSDRNHFMKALSTKLSWLSSSKNAASALGPVNSFFRPITSFLNCSTSISKCEHSSWTFSSQRPFLITFTVFWQMLQHTFLLQELLKVVLRAMLLSTSISPREVSSLRGAGEVTKCSGWGQEGESSRSWKVKGGWMCDSKKSVRSRNEGSSRPALSFSDQKNISWSFFVFMAVHHFQYIFSLFRNNTSSTPTQRAGPIPINSDPILLYSSTPPPLSNTTPFDQQLDTYQPISTITRCRPTPQPFARTLPGSASSALTQALCAWAVFEWVDMTEWDNGDGDGNNQTIYQSGFDGFVLVDPGQIGFGERLLVDIE